MPRTPDPDVHDRILDAAERLYRRSGEKGLTLRAVANAAGTTTPTVYKRFRNRAALITAMGLKFRERYLRHLRTSASLEAACREYLDFAVANRYEYQLAYGPHWPSILSGPPGEPGIEWAKHELARRFGGKPSTYDNTAQQVRLILHGTAMMLIFSRKSAAAKRIRKHCLSACDAMIANAGVRK